MNKLVKNASWIIVCKTIQSVLRFFIALISARYLGPSNYGLINYAQSLVVFVTPVMFLGLNNTMVMELVNRPEEEGKVLGTSLFYSFVSSIICTLCIIAFSFFANDGDPDTVIVCGLFSLSLITNAFELIEYWYQSKLLSKYHAVIALISYVIVSSYKIVLLVTGKSVHWFAVSYAFESGIIAVTLILLYKRKGGQRFKVSNSLMRDLVKRSSPYIIPTMMVAVFTQTDKLMLKQMLDSSATGFYAAAVVLGGLSSFVFQAIIDSYAPKLFEDYKHNGKAIFESGIISLYSLIIYASVLQAALFTVFAKPIVLLTYGKQYVESISALRIVSWFTTFSVLGVIRNIWILANEKQKYLTPINLCGAVCNVILNFLFIPRWGIDGAAVASLVTQFFTNVITGFFIKPIRHNNKLILKALNPRVAVSLSRQVLLELLRRKRAD